MTIGFPLLLIPLAIYNIVVFLMPGVSFTAALANVRLMSGSEWPMSFGDLLLAFSLFLLLLEVVKAARPGTKYLTDHLLSLAVFAAALAEFMLLAPFGTSAFFLLTVMMAVEFLAGAVSALRNRKYRAVDDAPADGHDMPRGDELERSIADVPVGSWGPEPLQRFAAIPESTPESPERAVTPPTPQSEASPIEKISPAPAAPEGPANADAPKSGRKVSEWSLADLVRDHPDETEKQPVQKPAAD